MPGLIVVGRGGVWWGCGGGGTDRHTGSTQPPGTGIHRRLEGGHVALGLGVWMIRGMLHAWLRASVMHQVLARAGMSWVASLRFAGAMSVSLAGITLITSVLLWVMGEIMWVPVWIGEGMGVLQVGEMGALVLLTWWLVWEGGMVLVGIWSSWAYQACLQERLKAREALVGW